MSNQEQQIRTDSDANQIISKILELPKTGAYKVCITKIAMQRTLLQNASLHKYCTLMAKALDESGVDYWGVLLSRTVAFLDYEKAQIDKKGVNVHPHDESGLRIIQGVYDSLPKFSCQWNGDLFKENVWRPFLFTAFKKISTTNMAREECTTIYENINRYFASNYGVSVPWPTQKEKDKRND